MPEESPLRILFREMLRENFDLIEDELRARGMDKIPLPKKAVSVAEAAKMANVCEMTIRRQIDSNKIPVLPGVSPKRIPIDFVDRMIKKESHA